MRSKMEHAWLETKVLISKKQVKMFECLLLQVLDWLANHGEVFLQKNTGIGRNLHKARVYQKSHEHFENVAQVSMN